MSILYSSFSAVPQAQSYLAAAMEGRPRKYQSRYAEQIESLYNRIMNRPAFSYDMNRDPLYRQYQDQYTRLGRRAMQDTVGQAAALTGGYGNSWAGTAGYQAYEAYLQALADRTPELEQRAQSRYQAEENTLRNNADLLLNLDNREYGWYRDAMNDWQFDAKLALEQAKFDWEVRKYQSKMLASLGGASGGGGGGGGSRGSGTAGKAAAAPAGAEKSALIYPVLPENVKELAANPAAPSVLSPTSSRGFTPQEWAGTKAAMQKINQNSFQTKARQAAKAAGSLTGLMVNAAKNGVVRGAALNKKK